MWTSLIIAAHIIVIIGVTLRVVMMRLPVGTALAGTWLVGNTAQDCKDPDTEYMEFRKNGTFETGSGGKAEITGFWQISGDGGCYNDLIHPHTHLPS